MFFDFSGKEFKDLLKNEFALGVAEKKYKKIPYTTWRSLMKIDDEDLVSLEVGELSFGFDTIPNIRFNIKTVYSGSLLGTDSNDQMLGTFFYYYLKNNKNVFGGNNNMMTSSINTKDLFFNCTTTSTNYYPNDNITTALPSNAIKTNSISVGTDEAHFDKVYVDDLVVKNTINGKKVKKENEDMSIMKFDFGPCDGNKVHMSMYGMAVKNAAGIWVSYDKDNRDIIDVDILNFDAGKFMFKMPVAVKDVVVGDVIIHNRVPMFVTKVNDTSFTAVDVYAGEEKNIIPTKNMFGFNFVTKVVSFIDTNGMSADTPFGNMLPFMLMGDGKDIDPMMLMMMMGNGSFDMSNPMMMYFMMKDSKDNDMLPLLMMMAPKAHIGNCGKDATCNCGKPPVTE